MKRKKHGQVFINGPIDLSAFINDVRITTEPDALAQVLPGLKSMGPVTLSVSFDDGRVTCGGCGCRFPLPSNTPTARVSFNGIDLGWACDKCTLAALDATE